MPELDVLLHRLHLAVPVNPAQLGARHGPHLVAAGALVVLERLAGDRGHAQAVETEVYVAPSLDGPVEPELALPTNRRIVFGPREGRFRFLLGAVPFIGRFVVALVLRVLPVLVVKRSPRLELRRILAGPDRERLLLLVHHRDRLATEHVHGQVRGRRDGAEQDVDRLEQVLDELSSLCVDTVDQVSLVDLALVRILERHGDRSIAARLPGVNNLVPPVAPPVSTPSPVGGVARCARAYPGTQAGPRR